jgi:uncharacterized repeat protein (TIGR01451 family)/fimbrial isopeptide formation D2 family protein
MFRKLVSNLPFSPSLINQIGYYSKRLKKEQFTRKFGLLFTVLALLVQSITLISPAKATLAASNNDILFGGGDKAAIQRAFTTGCDSRNRCDIQAIFSAYGIDASNLNSARYETINSSIANDYWSIGRSPRGYGGEVPRQIPGGPVVWSRTLHGWAANRDWQALRVDTAQGVRWILTECGNVVTQPNTPTTTPNMKVDKTVDKPVVNKGDKVTYTIKLTNIGDGVAKNVLASDDSPVGLDLLNDGLTQNPIKSVRHWETSNRFDVAPGQSITFRIKAIATIWGPVSLTNRACVDFFDINVFNNCDTATVRIPQGCPVPGKRDLPKNDPSCTTNPNLEIIKTSNKPEVRVGDTFEYTLTATNKGDVFLPNVYIQDVAPDELEFVQVKEPGASDFTNVTNPREYISKNFSLRKGASTTATLRVKVLSASTEVVKNTACVISAGDDTTANACDDEDIKITDVCTNCTEIELHKKAKNITQQIQDANGSTAQAGDTIEYTLSVTNRSDEDRKGFVIEENMEDVLEYADIIDASGATFTENPVKMLTWQPVDIKPNETVNRTILVKIKSVIPTTPASTSDPLSNDMKLVNVYGDTVQISLPLNPVKTIESTVTSLPSTGLGTNIAISTTILFITTYFYYRSRLMVKELGLVKQQFNSGAPA